MEIRVTLTLLLNHKAQANEASPFVAGAEP